DAVIDTEKIMRRLEARNDGSDASLAGISFQTTLETRSASVYAMAIVMLAVTPIFFMGGVSGAFFEPLALAYLLAVAASMLVALTVTPVLSLMLLGKGGRSAGEPPLLARLSGLYEDVLRRALAARRKLFVAAAVAVVGGIALWPFLGQSLLPALKKRDLLRQMAEEVTAALAGIRGIADLRAEDQVEEPHVQVKVDLDAAGKAGVKPGDVRRASATIFSGLTVGFLFEEQKIYDVVVW